MRNLLHTLVFFFLIIGCAGKKASPKDQNTLIENFANKVVSELQEGHAVVLDLHLDKTIFVKRVVEDSYWDEQLNLAGDTLYKTNYSAQLIQELSLAKMFLSGVNPRQYFAYDVVKVYEIDNRWHAVFRMYANEAINYHDYLLRVDSNKVWIEDVYIMTVGRELSKIMQEMYAAGIQSPNHDVRWRDLQLLGRTKNWMANQNYPVAIQTFDSLSTAFKAQKSMRLFWLQIMGNVPDEAYIRAIEAYEKNYPNDAGTLLLQLDKNFLFGDYPSVLKDLLRLERMYGKDPVIEFLRGNALYGLGECEKAIAAYKLATAKKKDWPHPWQNSLECWLSKDKYPEALHVLDTLVARYDYTPTYAKYVLSDYPRFLSSEEFKTWAELNALK